MADEVSPFVVGARVAVEARYHASGVYEDVVEKVYKTGRFTLFKNPGQQWRPEKPSSCSPYWSARQTGDGWRRDRLKIWDDTTDAEIVERFATAKRQDEWSKVCKRINDIARSEATDRLIADLDAAVNAFELARTS